MQIVIHPRALFVIPAEYSHYLNPREERAFVTIPGKNKIKSLPLFVQFANRKHLLAKMVIQEQPPNLLSLLEGLNNT